MHLDFAQTNDWGLSFLKPEKQMRDVEFPELSPDWEGCVESCERKRQQRQQHG
jgi:hypothetical protein